MLSVNHVIMKDKITDIMLSHSSNEITIKEAIDKLCDLHSVSLRFPEDYIIEEYFDEKNKCRATRWTPKK